MIGHQKAKSVEKKSPVFQKSKSEVKSAGNSVAKQKIVSKSNLKVKTTSTIKPIVFVESSTTQKGESSKVFQKSEKFSKKIDKKFVKVVDKGTISEQPLYPNWDGGKVCIYPSTPTLLKSGNILAAVSDREIQTKKRGRPPSSSVTPPPATPSSGVTHTQAHPGGTTTVARDQPSPLFGACGSTEETPHNQKRIEDGTTTVVVYEPVVAILGIDGFGGRLVSNGHESATGGGPLDRDYLSRFILSDGR
ncbi:hypothetical protein R6Q59_018833 [Mikania micrantha]